MMGNGCCFEGQWVQGKGFCFTFSLFSKRHRFKGYKRKNKIKRNDAVLSRFGVWPETNIIFLIINRPRLEAHEQWVPIPYEAPALLL